MDALCAAIPIARSLLRLADSACSTRVSLHAGHRSISMHVVKGYVHEVQGVEGELLGDALLRMGALDVARHEAALAAGYPQRFVGSWLTAVGAATEQSVRAALERQLTMRVAALLRLRGAEMVFTPARTLPEPQLVVTVDMAVAVYTGLLAIAHDLPRDVLIAQAGVGPLRCTRLGAWLEQRLQRGLPELELAPLLASQPQPSSLPARAALRAVGALSEGPSELDGYSLLLRKRRELRTRPSARRLLDLPENAGPEQARAAFRRLARKLHPDRFQAADPALLALSNEVMRALSSAAAELSCQTPGAERVRA